MTTPNPYDSTSGQYGETPTFDPYADQSGAGHSPSSAMQPYSGQGWDQSGYGEQRYAQQQAYGQQSGAMQPTGYNAMAPYGIDPKTGLPFSEKTKTAAGLLQLLLPGLAVGRFYMGDTKTAVIQLVVNVVTLGFGTIWPFIDGIIILAGDPKDSNGLPLR